MIQLNASSIIGDLELDARKTTAINVFNIYWIVNECTLTKEH